MKLELKHIAKRLPFGVKCLNTYTNKIGQISNVYTIGEGYDNDDIKLSIDYSEGEHIWMYKPILRPLSDLTNPITHNGETFVPIERLWHYGAEGSVNVNHKLNYKGGFNVVIYDDWVGCTNYRITPINLKYSEMEISIGDEINFSVSLDSKREEFYNINTDPLMGACHSQNILFEKLLEWHFDVDNLIENGLAIDVNELETNPYK